MCNIRPEKKAKERTRFVVGGDRINCSGEVATPTADMLVAKFLFGSIVLTKDATFMTMDISNFYLMTPLKRPEYIQINIKDILEEIILKYNLREMAIPNESVHIVAIVEGTVCCNQDCLPTSFQKKTTQQERILSKQIGTRALETHMVTWSVHTDSR